MSRPTVPPPSDDDHEDVAWALRAASAQWRREDHADAISWVRRAAETAVEVGQALRARDLFQLAKYLEGGPLPDSMNPGHQGASSVFPPGLSSAPAPSAPSPMHPAAIAPPPPSFGSSYPPGHAVQVEFEDEDSDVVEEIEAEEFLDEDDEVIIDDEIEELEEAPPASLGSPAYGEPSNLPAPAQYGSAQYGSEHPGSAQYGSAQYGSAQYGPGHERSSGARPVSEPSTRYSSAPPPRGFGTGSQFPSQIPTRTLARPHSSSPAPSSGRPGSRALSSRPAHGPGSLPPLPSLGPTGGLTRSPSSQPGRSWGADLRGDPDRRVDYGTPSEPIVPARPTSQPPNLGSRTPGRRPSLGFDEAFLDSLEEDAPDEHRGTRPKVPPIGRELESDSRTLPREPDVDFGELDFGRGPSSAPRTERREPLPSVPDLPSMGASPAISPLPIDEMTAAEYAQRSRGAHFEAHEQIEEELGVDLSLRTPRPGPRRQAQPDYSPTPGRVSSRPMRPTALGLGDPPSTSGEQPFPLAPSASAPPVAPIDLPSSPSQAPPPESMEEPDGESQQGDRRSYDLSGEVFGDRAASPPPPPAVAEAALDDDDDILADAFQRLQSAPPVRPASEQPAVKSESPPSRLSDQPAAGSTIVDGTDLLEVPGLQDLPEDAAAALAARAKLVDLAPGEEVSSFGVALVTAGAVQLMPTIADASSARARKGDVLFTRGTMDSSIDLRVVGAEPGSRVAVFSERDLQVATASCPWVADELAEVADRYNAFGGAVLGPLGESLDEMFRMMVFEKCTVKNPPPGSLIAEAGKPMDGMYVLGSGTLEVVSETGSVTARLSPGDFVFPETVLGAGPASSSVRVPSSGALVLFANRMSAHELLATCPPFIEILAGG